MNAAQNYLVADGCQDNCAPRDEPTVEPQPNDGDAQSTSDGSIQMR